MTLKLLGKDSVLATVDTEEDNTPPPPVSDAIAIPATNVVGIGEEMNVAA